MLFPIALARFDDLRASKCFDDLSGRDDAREIREHFIPDFPTWRTDHDAYQRAFDRVVKSLGEKRASATPRAANSRCRSRVIYSFRPRYESVEQPRALLLENAAWRGCLGSPRLRFTS